MGNFRSNRNGFDAKRSRRFASRTDGRRHDESGGIRPGRLSGVCLAGPKAERLEPATSHDVGRSPSEGRSPRKPDELAPTGSPEAIESPGQTAVEVFRPVLPARPALFRGPLRHSILYSGRHYFPGNSFRP
jgi:hypothetical protein